MIIIFGSNYQREHFKCDIGLKSLKDKEWFCSEFYPPTQDNMSALVTQILNGPLTTGKIFKASAVKMSNRIIEIRFLAVR